ncbi:histone H1/H5 family protein [Asticcacaulis excentricus]|uniref:DUF3253 domain-containing protein n=1 Tax=Asticcacaulis excentricus (strain ATCC 15261 / DSM 4724 / KCTC 12464 / NCIMB 9791 / VKM B-1370 / CB 48) TaxID=573065 RepID=E8RQ89_ASTEC|nr:histone H1/H5 family protein [Asticcacaulis excentricus]ADU13191.1 Protein of unknown function DUF3253 [Asticcacaulis excentricus CB 48]
MANPVEELIVELLTELGDKETLSPNQVAKTINAENWRRQLPQVRAAIGQLVEAGRIEVVRKGKVVAFDGIRGIWRIRLAGAA